MIGLLLVGLLGAGAFYAWRQRSPHPSPGAASAPAPSSTKAGGATSVPTVGADAIHAANPFSMGGSLPELNYMTLTNDLTRDLLERLEGVRLDAYQDTGGVWTIGIGHVCLPSEPYHPYGTVRRISRDEVDRLFVQDIGPVRSAVTRLVKVAINVNQRAALESFAFNVGITAFQNSTLLRKLNAGDATGAATEFDKWVLDNGQRVAGLVNRRNVEQELFLS